MVSDPSPWDWLLIAAIVILCIAFTLWVQAQPTQLSTELVEAIASSVTQVVKSNNFIRFF